MADPYKVAPYSGRDVGELAAYVQRELARIEEGFRLAWGGGTIFRGNDTPAAAITVPADGSYIKLTDYDEITPKRDFRRLVPDLDGAQLVVRDPGLWGFIGVANGIALHSARDYEMRLFANDVQTAAFATLDLSNQSVQAELVVCGVVRVTPQIAPTRVDLRLRQRATGTAAPWTTAGLYLTAWSVGD